jgi:methylmalonyl-CoA mutase C-terminal domain/subunit
MRLEQTTRLIPRIILGKTPLDGHDAGVKFVARALMRAGMEVVYTGIYISHEELVETALQEDADVIGISSHCGQYVETVTGVIERLRARDALDVAVVLGGIIADEDDAILFELGVKMIFRPGTPISDMTAEIERLADERRTGRLRSSEGADG